MPTIRRSCVARGKPKTIAEVASVCQTDAGIVVCDGMGFKKTAKVGRARDREGSGISDRGVGGGMCSVRSSLTAHAIQSAR